ncbi:MAG: hypothetical protein M1836_004452 [Candelina mexicana]|nr:MAG: hypothetical protein M1836_004452 [Candelina mexicana]
MDKSRTSSPPPRIPQEQPDRLSFSIIPGELRNRIYDAVILAAFGTFTPVCDCRGWSYLGWVRGCRYWVSRDKSYYHFLRQKDIAPWNGFRTSTSQIYQEFTGRLASQMSFQHNSPGRLLSALEEMPQLRNIRHLEIDIAHDCSSKTSELLAQADAKFYEEHGYELLRLPNEPEWEPFKCKAAGEVGRMVMTIASSLELKTLAVEVYSIRDFGQWSRDNGEERAFVRGIADLIDTKTEFCLIDSMLPPEVRNQYLEWPDSKRDGKRTSLATALDLISE